MADYNSGNVTFVLGDMVFEYDEEKNQANIKNHGISFKNAARIFFDYDRIEYFDEESSVFEKRYDTIGDLSAGGVTLAKNGVTIGNIGKEDVLFVVYTERVKHNEEGKEIEITRIISARYATNFERGLYYGKH